MEFKIHPRSVPEISVQFFVSSFLFYFPGFLYQNSKASRWIYWNPELNRDLVPAVAGQNHNYFQTGKETKKHPTGPFSASLLQVIVSWNLDSHSKKICWYLQRAVIWLHFLGRCVHLQTATLPARPQNAPVSITVVQLCRASRSAWFPAPSTLLSR